MPILHQIVRWALIIQALSNIIQGTYIIIIKPYALLSTGGPKFSGTFDVVVQSIGSTSSATFVARVPEGTLLIAIAGIGALVLGIYGTAGAYGNDRRFFAITAAMREMFGIIILS